jgi:hypothetical protein
MSANDLQGQLDRKRKQRLEAERKAGESRSKESQKRSEAAKARLAASKTKTASTSSSRLKEAERREKEAEAAAKAASQAQSKAASYANEENRLAVRLGQAQKNERDREARERIRLEKMRERRHVTDLQSMETRILTAGRAVTYPIPAPKPEKLRILFLGASSAGDLRVARESARIRRSVESAALRDQVEMDIRPAATTADLLDGITKFRPHVIHFSGHSNEELIEFEDEFDIPHDGVVVTAKAFARAVSATDSPPTLVFLNSCNSAGQLERLIEEGVAPFAIGMADEVEDVDAIIYAAQFYAAVANGQSIHSAHLSGQAALELAGADGADLPTLASAQDTDAAFAWLVKPPAALESDN